MRAVFCKSCVPTPTPCSKRLTKIHVRCGWPLPWPTSRPAAARANKRYRAPSDRRPVQRDQNRARNLVLVDGHETRGGPPAARRCPRTCAAATSRQRRARRHHRASRTVANARMRRGRSHQRVDVISTCGPQGCLAHIGWIGPKARQAKLRVPIARPRRDPGHAVDQLILVRRMAR